MEHNFGHYAGSLLYCLGSMSKTAEHDLKQKDQESIRVAKRKHTLIAGGGRTKHRKKTNVNSSSSYDTGMDSIE